MALGHDLAMGLRGAYLSTHRQANAHFARFGVTADQFVLLTQLARQDGITQQELVHRIYSDPNTVRAMLVLLERRGFVVRERHATDGRARNVVLTKEGRRVQQKLWAEADAFHSGLLALVRPEELAIVTNCLERIAKGMALMERRIRSSARRQI